MLWKWMLAPCAVRKEEESFGGGTWVVAVGVRGVEGPGTDSKEAWPVFLAVHEEKDLGFALGRLGERVMVHGDREAEGLAGLEEREAFYFAQFEES